MTLLITRLVFVFVFSSVAAGCARMSPRFETSDRAPEPTEDDALSPHEPQVEDTPASQTRLEELTNQFLLVLSNRAVNELPSLLTSDAVVRRYPTAGGLAALPELIQIASEWDTEEAPGSGQPPSHGGFGPTRITTIQAEHAPPWAQIAVDGPTEVQGQWKLVFGSQNGAPLIQEVVLPKTR